jgi:hypothetical protein
MEHNVNEDAGTQRFVESFASGAINNLLDGKINHSSN